jgi:hypothetical protein
MGPYDKKLKEGKAGSTVYVCSVHASRHFSLAPAILVVPALIHLVSWRVAVGRGPRDLVAVMEQQLHDATPQPSTSSSSLLSSSSSSAAASASSSSRSSSSPPSSPAPVPVGCWCRVGDLAPQEPPPRPAPANTPPTLHPHRHANGQTPGMTTPPHKGSRPSALPQRGLLFVQGGLTIEPSPPFSLYAEPSHWQLGGDPSTAFKRTGVVYGPWTISIHRFCLQHQVTGF